MIDFLRTHPAGPLEEIIKGMLEDIKKFASGQAMEDDFTLFIFRFVMEPE